MDRWLAAVVMYKYGYCQNGGGTMARTRRDLGSQWTSERSCLESERRISHLDRVRDLSVFDKQELIKAYRVDQTTRIYGELFHSDPSQGVWHEIARPQVHGYDLLDVAFLNSLKFVSIADEKVARVFEGPRNFVQLAKTLDVAHFPESEVCLWVACGLYFYSACLEGKPAGWRKCSSSWIIK